MSLGKQTLGENGMEYTMCVAEDKDVVVDQLFFHDPDGNMIEICNCNKKPPQP
jgi:catechol 2,3-dioxygenase-like lactoylglutathione lyase family enzyme